MRSGLIFLGIAILALFLAGCEGNLAGEARKVKPPTDRPSAVCADSDGGIIPEIKGTTTLGTKSETDYCRNSATLIEYYCRTSSRMGKKSIPCEDNKYMAPGISSVCDDGTCVSTGGTDTCTDTDGGINLYVVGTVYGMNGSYNYSYTDHCSGAQVFEYYCSDNTAMGTVESCGDGEACEAGICVTAGLGDLIVFDIVFEDSQGNPLGNNISDGTVFHPLPMIQNIGSATVSLVGVRHSVSFDGSGPSAIGDCASTATSLGPGETYKCKTANLGGFGQSLGAHTVTSFIDYGNVVQEEDESNNDYSEVFYVVGTPPSTDYCWDSDGGNNIYMAGYLNGSMNGSTYTMVDYCVDGNTMREYYCEGDYPRNNVLDCPSGMECQNAACVNETIVQDSCEETDGGWDYTTWGLNGGYQNGVHFSVSDFCVSNSTLLEYACVGTQLLNGTFDCYNLNLTACAGGRCT